MGDFNTVNNLLTDKLKEAVENTKASGRSKEKWKPEIQLFLTMEDLGFLDIHKYWEEMENGYRQISYTWKNARLLNRIDYMWLSQNLVLNIHSFKNKEYK